MDQNDIKGKEIEFLVPSEDSGKRKEPTKKWRTLKFSADELSRMSSDFVQEIGNVLQSIPEVVGDFEFSEIHIAATITGGVKSEARFAVLSFGGEIGATGGMKFVFKRRTEDKRQS